VPRPRYPVIDVHNHVSLIFGTAPYVAPAEQAAMTAAKPDWERSRQRIAQMIPAMDNERYEELQRHPRTTFVCLHIANHPENLDEVTEWLHRHPNMHCEIAAQVGELGRQPRRDSAIRF
jgi:hypothetical protein